MFNVYPVELRYTVTHSSGMFRGVPFQCTVGVPSVAAAKALQEKYEKSVDLSYSNFEIAQKH